MKCLGCGGTCKCAEPATFPTWPLEQSLTREALEKVAMALEDFLLCHEEDAEIRNTANVIRSHLERPDDLLA